MVETRVAKTCGSVRAFEAIWLEPRMADKLAAMRGPGASYSDVILRLAGALR
jgi:hypothetical protein